MPFLFVVVPELLMEGPGFSVAWVAIKSALGIWMVSVALMGYVIAHINVLQRVLFFIAGAAMFAPHSLIDIGFPVAVPGIVLVVVLVGMEWTKQKQQSAA